MYLSSNCFNKVFNRIKSLTAAPLKSGVRLFFKYQIKTRNKIKTKGCISAMFGDKRQAGAGCEASCARLATLTRVVG